MRPIKPNSLSYKIITGTTGATVGVAAGCIFRRIPVRHFR